MGAIVVAGLLALIWAVQRRLMYFPIGDVPPPAVAGLDGVEAVRFTTDDGVVLNGWFLPSVRPAPWFTVLVFNGNAGNRALRAPLGAALRAEGISVLLVDYRGFGGNGGAPTEQGLAADARAARAYVLGRPDVDSSRLVYFGESLGTGVATALAAQHPPAALILRSPFPSMTAIARLHYPFLPVGWLLRDRYESIRHISRIACPLLIIAGDADRIIPVEQSRELYEAARSAKTLVIVPGADHNDLALLAGPVMIEAIVNFLRRVG
jgi:fermentation-respiration switch protein FrsA (DUF1100 family)